MNNSYDYHRAEGLIPLLQVLSKEISERTEAIRKAGRQIRTLLGKDSNLGPHDREHARAVLESEIATHKREIRCTMKELARLGCSLDEANPSVFLIPGHDGTLEGGFAWSSGDTGVHIHSDK